MQTKASISPIRAGHVVFSIATVQVEMGHVRESSSLTCLLCGTVVALKLTDSRSQLVILFL